MRRFARMDLCRGLLAKPQTMSYNILNLNKVVSYITPKHFSRGLCIKRVSPATLEKGDELSVDLVSPWFVSGFVDAEGSFVAIVRKNAKHRLGWPTIYQKPFINRGEVFSYSRFSYSTFTAKGKDKSIAAAKFKGWPSGQKIQIFQKLLRALRAAFLS